MLDQAFDALKTYDWGTDLNLLKPIDEAIVSSHGNDVARRELELRLVAVLATNVSRDAKDFICRKLRIIGTAASVPALAALLLDKDNSHMARYALERIPAPEAGTALRESLSKLSGPQKVGAIGSLGARKEEAAIADLGALLGDSDASIARAAACALGNIRTQAAAAALMQAKPTSEAQLAVNDARLAYAEGLLAQNNKSEAKAIYKSLTAEEFPKFIRIAATRGMLACAAKKI